MFGEGPIQRESETKDVMFRFINPILTPPLGTNMQKKHLSYILRIIPLLRVFLLSFLLVSATTPTKTIVPHEELVVQLNCLEFTPNTINTVNLLGCGATMMSTRRDGFGYDIDGNVCKLFNQTRIVTVGIPTGNYVTHY